VLYLIEKKEELNRSNGYGLESRALWKAMINIGN
jgi:hypothetical protein